MRLQSLPAERRHCLECDAQVCRDFRRVYGDRDDRAHRCPECDTWVRLCEGSAAGKDVPMPDPKFNCRLNASPQGTLAAEDD